MGRDMQIWMREVSLTNIVLLRKAPAGALALVRSKRAASLCLPTRTGG